jgi:hypothetical protein
MKLITKCSLFVCLLVLGSCTNLDEEELLYDTVIADNFYKTDAELASAVGAAYGNLYGIGGNNHVFPLAEVTSDEMVVPQRGADWGDGGHWVRLKLHTYKKDDPIPNNGWNFAFGGVTTCNKLLVALSTSTSPNAPGYAAELKALRAIYYLWLIDWFGNVPITTDFTNTEPPKNNTRAEVYAFIEKELLENIPKLPVGRPGDGPLYGRVTAYTCNAALAKLYLNAEIYTGTQQWDKAIAQCDNIINPGVFALTATYQENFSKDNKNSREFIWAIPYDHVYAPGFNIPMMTLSYLSQATYNINAQPWNGFATVQEFYESYIDSVQNPGPTGRVIGLSPAGDSTRGVLDKRLTNFLVGPQFSSTGARLSDGGADLTDPDGNPLTYTPYINELAPNAWRQSGARVNKWIFFNGMTQDLDNDFAIFRYADILLMKAELVARKNANWNDPVALAIVNQIRTQHGGVTPFTSMTKQTFLAERGREMFAECWRRQDMIRFDTYNSAFRFHPADASKHVNLFPIPESQLNANKNLVQNPGY